MTKSFPTLAGIVAVAALLTGHLARPAMAQDLTPAEVRAIAADAYVYGYPIVDNYRVQYSYFEDQADPDFKAARNILFNVPRVFTHEDRAVQTPNSDTPYSWIGLDLRAEPLVFTVPPIPAERYFSVQLIDLYTFNFDYIGSRATGNDGGHYLVAGPGWTGETPTGITAVIRSETEIGMALFRTQLFNPDDLDTVKAIQAQYIVQPLSAFLGEPAPAPAAPFGTVQPLSVDAQQSSVEVFNLLNYLLQYAPVNPVEADLRARFAQIGIEAGHTIDFAALSPDVLAAYQDGIADGKAAIDAVRAEVNAGRVTSGDLFGTREYLAGNYPYRAAGALLGIYGNSKDEAMYPAYFVDAEGQPLTGANAYTLRFTADQLPPVNAFWSMTMYEQPASLLVANPINRYLLNSPMLDSFVRDADGGLTFLIQTASPGEGLEANWLPAPAGPFSVIMRLYWPKEAALDGTWTAPPMTRAE